MAESEFIENLDLKYYPHFDKHLSKSKIAKLVNNRDAVKKHPFHPFLYFEQKFTKFRLEKGLAPVKKTRPIRYACRADSYIYSKYRNELSGLYEGLLESEKLSDSIVAYRRIPKPEGGGKCNIDFAKEAFDKIIELENCVVVTADISSYFDTIDHEILKSRWAKLLGIARLPDDHFAVFKSLTGHSHVDYVDLCRELGIFGTKKTKYGEIEGFLKPKKEMETQICDNATFRKLVEKRLKAKNPLIKKNLKSYGIPQGTPMSDLLANLYLIEFDKSVRDYCDSRGGIYFRYSDDILIILPTDKSDIQRHAEEFLQKEITNAGPKIRIQKKKCASLFYFKGVRSRELKFEPLSPHKGKKKRVKTGKQVRGKDEYKVVAYDSYRMNNGLEYLGFRFDGVKVYIKDKTLSGFYRKLKTTAWAEAYSHYERNRGVDRVELLKRFNFEKYIAKFGQVEGFFETSKDPTKPDYKKWTFHTYLVRATKVFGELGDGMPLQVKGYKEKAKADVYKKIGRVYKMRTKKGSVEVSLT